MVALLPDKPIYVSSNRRVLNLQPPEYCERMTGRADVLRSDADFSGRICPCASHKLIHIGGLAKLSVFDNIGKLAIILIIVAQQIFSTETHRKCNFEAAKMFDLPRNRLIPRSVFARGAD